MVLVFLSDEYFEKFTKGTNHSVNLYTLQITRDLNFIFFGDGKILRNYEN